MFGHDYQIRLAIFSVGQISFGDLINHCRNIERGTMTDHMP
jgi:hypothetical protein